MSYNHGLIDDEGKMNSWNKTRTVFMLGLFCLMLGICNLVLFIPKNANGGAYLNSAHANSSYGADRLSINGLGYTTKGLCLHCHEQHASISGFEPDPAGGAPDKYALFYTNYVSQTDNFCMKCHDHNSSIATSAITNHSYSYRAGGYASDFMSSIYDAYTNAGIASNHNLDDIQTFITGKWSYTADSNPCAACHNPHSAQGDPLGTGGGKSSSARGWPVSKPSSHGVSPRDNDSWGLWGDNSSAERMNIYTTYYQAPYYTGSGYEPDGTSTSDGSNLTDFVTFCTDCHTTTDTNISSTALGRTLKVIDWSASTGDTHGGQQSTVTGGANPGNTNPYATTNQYVLACTDCHEPHGSPNSYLLRPEVNNTSITSFTNGYFANFCVACHTISYNVGTHSTNGVTSGSDCSISGCHYHGAGRSRF